MAAEHSNRLRLIVSGSPRVTYDLDGGSVVSPSAIAAACLLLGAKHIKLPDWAKGDSHWLAEIVGAVYDSVVTLTTIGFGDPAIALGAVIVTIQVILGRLVSVLADKVARRS